MNGPRSEREGVQSRSGRRIGTKAPGHKAAQRATRGALRAGQRVHPGTGKTTIRTLRLFTVRNVGTKREIVIRAMNFDNAIAIALARPYHLAKSAAKLTATPVS